jgi:hypothetical protein
MAKHHRTPLSALRKDCLRDCIRARLQSSRNRLQIAWAGCPRSRLRDLGKHDPPQPVSSSYEKRRSEVEGSAPKTPAGSGAWRLGTRRKQRPSRLLNLARRATGPLGPVTPDGPTFSCSSGSAARHECFFCRVQSGEETVPAYPQSVMYTRFRYETYHHRCGIDGPRSVYFLRAIGRRDNTYIPLACKRSLRCDDDVRCGVGA